MSTGSEADLAGPTRLVATARAGRRQPSPRARKIALTLHVTSSVGWLGSAYTMLVLNASGLLSADTSFRLACYEVAHLFDRAVNLPLGFSMLLTGLLSSLGTKWGLVKHRWVFAKLAISTTALLLVPILSVPRLLPLIDQLHTGAPETPGLAVELLAISIGTVTTLTAVTAISIFKPWGRTRWGRR